MLDQNTDRMWYVIGAVIVGAALIFLMNGTFPGLFGTIGESFQDRVDVVSDVIEKERPGGPAEQTDGIKPPVKGDGVNLSPNGDFLIDSETNELAFPYGLDATVVRDGLFQSSVTSSRSWAKRFDKTVTIAEPGTYTYSLHAKLDTDVTEAVWFRQLGPDEGSAPVLKDAKIWSHPDANLEEGPAFAVVQSVAKGEWKTYHVTFTVTKPGKQTLRMYLPFAEIGDTVAVDWEKLETGEVATPFNP